MSNIREELISNAVQFLRQQDVLSKPLEKKIEFLRGKGLSNEEIEQSIQLARNVISGLDTPTTSRPWDWRDWFIMGVLGSGFAWSAYTLVKKYVMPMVQPPTRSQYEIDKEELELKYESTQSSLHALGNDTKKVLEETERQQEVLDLALDDLEDTLKQLKQNDDDRDRDMARLSQDVYTLSTITLPNALKEIRDTQATVLTQLAQEVRSLRQLQGKTEGHNSSELSSTSPASSEPLDAKGSAPDAAATATLQPVFKNKIPHAIPPWQAAMHAQTSKTIQESAGETKQQTENEDI
ncbi:peroxisomal docking protein Pex14 [Schizosaccharomyces japonicus yFS275]|uniref:Peroxisomal membrane protein PEX14 n=1 Tax=Schizosaccharomyces japonicus (strain yFS275 / FY16936) TaxID=402676 RepID=B6JWW6_SCHJY|nr:peroxisomal docking protein Pex14 [Schizosaccharomyces japonicus yFS275]EEB05867.1 peroxisomal docking protein Pex14 [Schizosaccharomyces japonicus yFS275]